jgi:hypothetical protein
MSQTKKEDKKRGTVPFRLEILYKGTKHRKGQIKDARGDY